MASHKKIRREAAGTAAHANRGLTERFGPRGQVDGILGKHFEQYLVRALTSSRTIPLTTLGPLAFIHGEAPGHPCDRESPERAE